MSKNFKSSLGIYRGKRVLVTGHTGFKGSWLSIWLKDLGAKVYGLALEPHTEPNLYTEAAVAGVITGDDRVDIRDFTQLQRVFRDVQPEIVLHLAAQPIVRKSYETARETFEVNTQGTANVLQAANDADSVRSLVYISTDKCYRNVSKADGYRETDPFGGHDPYSASKGAAEIVFDAYQESFFKPAGRIWAASGRAGNVIGGGDWAEDRIIPDCVRALTAMREIRVRNAHATRPWQHVLEALSGYLFLGALLYGKSEAARGGWNFGPEARNVQTVQDLVIQVLTTWGEGDWADHSDPNAPHEADILSLDCSKAKEVLDWSPRWGFEETVNRTVSWYQRHWEGSEARDLCLRDIRAYMDAWPEP